MAQPEIRVHPASKGGVIDLVGSKNNVSIVAKNAKITIHDADEKGEIKLDKTTNRTDIVIHGSLTGAATDGVSNSASIPNSTEAPDAEIIGSTSSRKIHVKLRSTANKLTKHGEFESDEKVSDKIKEIKAVLEEKGEIQLYHEDEHTMIVVSKSFGENGIEADGTIVVKAELLCNTAAPPSQVRQIV